MPTNLEDGLFTPRLHVGLAIPKAGSRLSNVLLCGTSPYFTSATYSTAVEHAAKEPHDKKQSRSRVRQIGQGEYNNDAIDF